MSESIPSSRRRFLKAGMATAAGVVSARMDADEGCARDRRVRQ